MDKVFTNLEHAAWLREQARINRPYWYGVYYLKCTEALLKRKAAQYPEHYGASRMARYRADIAAGQICGDCVNGAIKGAVWSELGKREPVYKSHDCPDKSADGMFEYCKQIGMSWGAIDGMPDVIGLAVRMHGHVGVYVGGGEVVEWRGFAHGCVLTKLRERPWLHWYELPWTEYVDQANDEVTLRRGCKGEDVRTLQKQLMTLGYALAKYGADGDYGEETEAAVKAFQQAAGLTVDGIAGEKTRTALEAAAANLGTVTIKNGRWNVRTGSGTEYEDVGTVSGGDRLVKAETEGWVPVVFEGAIRWVSEKAVES